MSEVSAADHREAVRVVEVRRPGIRRHLFLARVDQLGVARTGFRRRPHSEQSVLGVEDHLATFGHVRGDPFGDADTEIDVRAVGNVDSAALRHFISSEANASASLTHGYDAP